MARHRNILFIYRLMCCSSLFSGVGMSEVKVVVIGGDGGMTRALRKAVLQSSFGLVCADPFDHHNEKLINQLKASEPPEFKPCLQPMQNHGKRGKKGKHNKDWHK